jgi:polysaccharide export outer membrane protein
VANVIATHLKKDFLRDPKVVVQLVETRPYFITGQVHKPGEYPYRPNLTLQSAIAIAGGPTFRASPRYFYVTRPSPATRYEVETSQPYNVQPGDVIDVPERLF